MLMRFAARAARTGIAAGFGAAAAQQCFARAEEGRARVPRIDRQKLREVWKYSPANQSPPPTSPTDWLHRVHGVEIPEATVDVPGVGVVRVYRDCNVVNDAKRPDFPPTLTPQDELLQFVFTPEGGRDAKDVHFVQFARPEYSDIISECTHSPALKYTQRWRRSGKTCNESMRVLWRRGEWAVDAPTITDQRIGVFIESHSPGNRSAEEVSFVVRPGDIVDGCTNRVERVRVDFDTYLIADGKVRARVCWGVERAAAEDGREFALMPFAAAAAAAFAVPPEWGELRNGWHAGWTALTAQNQPRVRVIADVAELLGERAATAPGEKKEWHLGPDGSLVKHSLVGVADYREKKLAREEERLEKEARSHAP